MDVVTTHISADLDALASVVALHLLHDTFEIAVPGGMESAASVFYQDHGEELPEVLFCRALTRRLAESQPNRLYVVDTAKPDRLGALRDHIPRFAEVLAWDNHPPAPGDLPRAEIVETGACVSALVLKLATTEIRPSAAEAGLFLLGIHQDTGHFTYASTTAFDHQAAAVCRSWGAPVDWPMRYVPRGFTRDELALLEHMARHVELIEEAGHMVSLIAVELETYQPDLAVLLEQLREAEKWPAAVLVATCGQRTLCIARSRGGLDAGEILRALGGGGHSEAASAVLKGMTFANARRLVHQTLVEFMGLQLTASNIAAQPVFSLPTTTPIYQVADELHRRRFNAMPLTAEREGEKAPPFVGLVTRQEVDAAVRHGLGERPVSEIVSRKPVWVKPETPLHVARRELFVGARRLLLVGHPPDAPEGVLTRGRVLKASEPDTDRTTAKRAPPPRVVLSMAQKHIGAMWSPLAELADLGHARTSPVYLVGGSVRDLLLGVPIRDVDVLVEGDAPALAQAAEAQLGGEAVVREGFGTARWMPPNGEPIDLASARSEYYAAPAALPEVAHASLEQDLYRRDFTINAMALALSGKTAGAIIDPHGGLADLNAGVLRVLHGLSFHDDPTRAFRAVRFAARLDFRLASDTLGLLKAARRGGAMDRLTIGRLGGELDLILDEREVVQAFRLLRQLQLHTTIHPELDAGRAFLEKLNAVRSARFRIQGLGTDVPAQCEVLWLVVASAVPNSDRNRLLAIVGGGRARLRRWMQGPEHVARALSKLCTLERRSDIARALQHLDETELIAAFGLAQSEIAREGIVWWLQHGRSIGRAFGGQTLLELGYKEGPRIKRGLDAALDAARNGESASAQLAAAQTAMATREHQDNDTKAKG